MFVDEDLLKLKIDSTGDLYIWRDPLIEEFEKEDFIELWKEIVKKKPKQLPIGEYSIKICDSGHCDFEGIIHKKQKFCPSCYELLNIVQDDANHKFDDLFQSWQREKAFMESIINGDIIDFVNRFNTTLENEETMDDNIIGEPINVEE